MKKITAFTAAALSVITVGIYGVGSASAQYASTSTAPSTATPLQSELSLLATQIAQLEAAISLPTGTSTVTITPIVPVTGINSATFSRNLTLGDVGPDVLALQKFLNAQGGEARIAISGSGSPGNETNYYGAYTQTAVARWQTEQGILPAQGFFDANTRRILTANIQ